MNYWKEMNLIKEITNILWISFIVFSMIGKCASTQCKHLSKIKGFENAIFNVIGFFPVNNERPDILSNNGIMMAEVMKLVIKMFNERHQFEVVGYTIYDTCSPDEVDILTEAVLTLELSNSSNFLSAFNENCPCAYQDEYFSRIVGIVGPSISAKCAHVNKLLSYQRLPMVSYGSTSPQLSDDEMFPNLFRTILPDVFQSRFIRDFLVSFNWTYISILHSDDTYGRSGAHALSKMHSLCVFLQRRIIFPIDDDFIVPIFNRLKESLDSNVIVLWGHFNLIQSILMKAAKYGVKGKTWIISEVSGRNTWFLEVENILVGNILVVVPNGGVFNEFEDYFFRMSYTESHRNKWVRTFFHKHGVNDTHGAQKTLNDFRHLFELENIGFIRNAVATYLFALEKATKHVPQDKFLITDHNRFSQQYIQPLRFSGLHNETITFDENGDVEKGAFKLYFAECRTNEFVLVASWSTETDLSLKRNPSAQSLSDTKSYCSDNCTSGYYPVFNGLKKCCWKCVACREHFIKPHRGLGACVRCPRFHTSNEDNTMCVSVTRDYLRYKSTKGAIICVVSSLGIFITLFALASFVIGRKTYIVRSSNITPSAIQLSLHLLIFILPHIFFGLDTTLKCTLRIIGVGSLFLLLSSTIMAKVYNITRLFKLKHRITPQDKYQIKTKMVLIVLTPLLFEIAGLVVLMQIHPVEISHNYIGAVNAENHDANHVCDADLLLGVIGGCILFYQIYCCIQAFQSRNLPDVYNEATFIAFAMFTSILVIVILIPLRQSYSKSSDKNFILSVGILVANLSILIILYGYKLCILWMNPNKKRVSTYNMTLKKMKKSPNFTTRTSAIPDNSNLQGTKKIVQVNECSSYRGIR